MAGRELPYDPYIPSGGSGQGGSAGYDGGNTRTAAIQSVRVHICCVVEMDQAALWAGFYGASAWHLHSQTTPSCHGHSYSLVLRW